MTKRQVLAITRELRGRMLLDHWDIRVDFNEPTGSKADATTWRANTYDTATIRLAAEWRSFDERRMRELIAHELGHLLTRDLDEAVGSIKDELSGEVWNLFYDRYIHEIEGVVDRYGRILAS